MNSDEFKAQLKELGRDKVLEFLYEVEQEVPEPLDAIVWQEVRTHASVIVEQVSISSHFPKDGEQLMFDVVMRAIYGPKYFDWHNRKLK